MTDHTRYGRYVVVSASARMPSSVKAPYRRVAVMDTYVPGILPNSIRDTARWHVVRTWERLRVGKSAYASALLEAGALAREMFYNGEQR